jgi:hypothetical protein
MQATTRVFLQRWLAFADRDGVARAARTARLLWVAGLLLTVLVVNGLWFGLHPVAVAILAGVAGWIIAETNALRSRIAQWPEMSQYIDWERVRRDMRAEPTAGPSTRP